MNKEPEFPTDSEGRIGPHSYNYEDMFIRDWFASHASEEDIAAYKNYIVNGNQFTHSRERAKYAYADAMMKAREAQS